MFLRRTRHVASIVILLVASGVALLSQTSKPPEPQPASVRADDNKQPDSAAPVDKPPDPIRVTITSLPPKTPDELKQEATDRTERRESEARSLFVNRLLALVAGITGLIVGWQAWETRKATAQADRHVRLLNQQWLDTDNWESFGMTRPDGTTYVLITFNVVNPTNMAVSVQRIEVSQNHKRTTIYETVNETLGPGRRYPIEIEYPITDNRIPRYVAGTLRVLITGSVSFTNAFGDERTQQFGRVCVAGHKTKHGTFLVIDQHLYDPQAPEDEDDE